MTGIKITKEQLEDLIEAHKPGWLKRAHDRTSKIPAPPAKPKFPELWSEIKEVYINLQGGGLGGKCAYCEKWLEYNVIEHDVEHFRPKGLVTRWMVPPDLESEFARAGIQVKQPKTGDEPGYRYLAYQILNYATACKECNSILKLNLFPIKGTRRSEAKDPTKLKSEGAFLIYPIDDVDTAPEDLIDFSVASPRRRSSPASIDCGRWSPSRSSAWTTGSGGSRCSRIASSGSRSFAWR